MKILLVNTNRIQPPIAPIALDYIGGSLERSGHTVKLLDLCLSDDRQGEVGRLLAAETFDAVALTFRNTDDCYFASGASFVEILRGDVAAVREYHGGPVIVGGGGFSLMPESLLRFTGADYGIVGDGEDALPALLDRLEKDLPVSDVAGLVWRDGEDRHSNGRASASLDDLSGASRSTVDNRTYFRRGGQIGFETKRGCPGRCIYCADPVIKGKAVRLRPPRPVAGELRNLLAMGIDHFHTCDSEFNLPPDHAAAVCAAIVDAGLGERIRWYAYAAPFPFDRRLGDAMLRAGCAGINFGVDSGSEAQLKRLGRSHDRRHILEAARICRDLGIAVMFDLLLGGPGETIETLRETVELMKNASPDRVGVSLGVRVYPGTPLHRHLAAGSIDPAGLRGNPDGLFPVFFMSPDLGEHPFDEVRELIGGDGRFLMPSGGDEQDYNYNDNRVLQEAIEAGCRGAYWDILRRLATASAPYPRCCAP